MWSFDVVIVARLPWKSREFNYILQLLGAGATVSVAVIAGLLSSCRLFRVDRA